MTAEIVQIQASGRKLDTPAALHLCSNGAQSPGDQREAKGVNCLGKNFDRSQRWGDCLVPSDCSVLRKQDTQVVTWSAKYVKPTLGSWNSVGQPELIKNYWTSILGLPAQERFKVSSGSPNGILRSSSDYQTWNWGFHFPASARPTLLKTITFRIRIALSLPKWMMA